jgi:hypothetical protein
MRWMEQNVRHPSAEILPWFPSPIFVGEAVHHEGSVVLSISAQISRSVARPRTRVFFRCELACFASANRVGSGHFSCPFSSTIPQSFLCRHYFSVKVTQSLMVTTYRISKLLDQLCFAQAFEGALCCVVYHSEAQSDK